MEATNRHVANLDEQAERDLARVDKARRVPPTLMRSEPDDIAPTDSEGKPRKQADVLVDIGRAHELFHDPGKIAYANVGGRVYAVESPRYREVLAERFLSVTGKGANRNSIGDAIATLASLAKFRGCCHRVWLRTAADGENVVFDTCDEAVIVVTADGIRTQCQPSVRFRRSDGMLALPKLAEPNFSRLWRYLNVCEEHRPLVAGFLLASLRPTGPFPILFLGGEQGTGKSTATRVLRRIIDPSTAPLRAPPKDVRDLLVGALNGRLLALDNLSYLTPQMSDALCRLATGGAISERLLYTNTEEVLIEVQCPVIVNGIEDVATRPDLAERGLHIELEMIRNRQAEDDFWRAFDADLPAIFTGLLHGLAKAIRDHRDIRIGPLPRMADFAKWAAAGMEPLGFTADDFMRSYRANLETGLSAGIESSAVGRALLGFVRNRGTWTGTAGDLLVALSRSVDESEARSQSWPRSPRALSGIVMRLGPALRHHGIDIERLNRSGNARTLTLCSRADAPSRPSQPSSLSDGGDEHDGRNRALHEVAGCSADDYRRARDAES